MVTTFGKYGNRFRGEVTSPRPHYFILPSFQPLLWSLPPMDPSVSLTPSRHILSSWGPGSEALANKDLRSYHIQVFPEWVGKRPRDGKELPKVTQQNETWTKGSCFSTLIFLESHRIWVALHSERTLAAPTGPRAIHRNLGSHGTRNQASSPICCVTSVSHIPL